MKDKPTPAESSAAARRDPVRARILRNSPASDRYDSASFVGRLVEAGFYAEDAYAELEEALARACRDQPLAAELDRHVFAIFREIALHFGFHADPRDVYRITSLADDDLVDLRNRVAWAFGLYFERALDPAQMPAPLRLPTMPPRTGPPVQAGDRFRVTRPLPALVMTHWRAPTTGSRDVVLRPPTLLRVESVDGERAQQATCLPEPRAELERRLVPWWDRWHPLYGGCSLVLSVDDLRDRCEPLPSAGESAP